MRPITINVNSHKDILPLVKQCRQGLKTTRELKSKDSKSDKVDASINNALDTLEKLATDKTQLVRVNKIAMWFIGVVISIIQSVIVVDYGIHTLLQTILTMQRSHISNKKKKVKDSDFMFNILDVEQIEFMCDEYVMMHGGGPFGVTSVEKLTRASELIVGKVLRKRPSESISSMVGIGTLLLASKVGDWNYRHTSDGTTYDRYQQMANSLLKTLRADALTPEIEEAVMREYEIVMASIAKSKLLAKDNSEEINRISIVLSKLQSLNGLMLFLMNGKRDEHYQDIMKASEHLMNTALVYHKKRLVNM